MHIYGPHSAGSCDLSKYTVCFKWKHIMVHIATQVLLILKHVIADILLILTYMFQTFLALKLDL